MADEFSFDIVSKVDLAEIENALNQANKEMQTRFDFRGSVSRVDFDKKVPSLTLFSDDEVKLKSVVDIIQSKLVKRGISLKALDFGKLEPAEKSTVRQTVKIQQGIPQEKAKEIVRSIKDAKFKVTPSIQSDQVRVTSRSKDELQKVITHARGLDLGIELQFDNYR